MTTPLLPLRPAVRRAPDWRPWRTLALLMLLLIGGLILLGTAGPPSVAAAFTDLLVTASRRVPWLLPGSGYDRVQAWANVAMFVPVGALLAMGLRPVLWPAAVLAGPALSLAAETAQRWIPGRMPDGADLVANSTGAVIGFLVGGAVVAVVATGSAFTRSRASWTAAERRG